MRIFVSYKIQYMYYSNKYKNSDNTALLTARYEWDNYYSSLSDICYTSISKKRDDLYFNLKLFKGLESSSNSDSNHRLAEIYETSSYILRKTKKFLNNDFLNIPNYAIHLKKDIFNLELKLSSELVSLNNQEIKLNEFLSFLDEYKSEFELTDEELWWQHGNELGNLYTELQYVVFTKNLINESDEKLQEAKWIIYSLKNKYHTTKPSDFRTKIAFSTKNLDDEHISNNTYNNEYFLNYLEIVLNEKTKYN